MPKTKAVLDDIFAAIFHAGRIVFIYILPSILVAMILSPDTQKMVVDIVQQKLLIVNPSAAWIPVLVNVIWAAVASFIKENSGDKSVARQVL